MSYRSVYDVQSYLMLPGWICTMQILHKPLTTAREELDDSDHGLSDLSDLSRGVKSSGSQGHGLEFVFHVAAVTARGGTCVLCWCWWCCC